MKINGKGGIGEEKYMCIKIFVGSDKMCRIKFSKLDFLLKGLKEKKN